jgi:hypothetical protein
MPVVVEVVGAVQPILQLMQAVLVVKVAAVLVPKEILEILMPMD